MPDQIHVYQCNNPDCPRLLQIVGDPNIAGVYYEVIVGSDEKATNLTKVVDARNNCPHCGQTSTKIAANQVEALGGSGSQVT